MYKLARYIETNGIEKSAGVLDKIKRLFTSTPDVSEYSTLKKGWGDLKSGLDKAYGSSKSTLNSRSNVDPDLAEKMELTKHIRKTYADIRRLNSKAETGKGKLATSFNFFNKDKNPLRLHLKASGLANKPAQIGDKNLNLEEAIRRVGLLDARQALGKHKDSLGAQKELFKLQDNVSGKLLRKQNDFLDTYVKNLEQGTPTKLKFRDQGMEQSVNLKMPLSMRTKDIEFDTKTMHGIPRDTFGSTMESARRGASTSGKSRIDNFSKYFDQNAGLNRNIEYSDLKTSKHVKAFLTGPGLNKKNAGRDLSTTDVSGIMAKLTKIRSSQKLDTAGAFKALVSQAKSSNSKSKVNQNLRNFIEHSRITPDEGKKAYSTFAKTKTNVKDETWRVGTDALALGGLGTLGLGIPYVMLKDEKKSNPQRRLPR